ncbi:MAG: hypothetical protein ACRBFS_06725 [Aureispira sp.]
MTNTKKYIQYCLVGFLFVFNACIATAQVDTLSELSEEPSNNSSNDVIIDLRQKYIYNDNKDTLILPDVNFISCIYQPLEVVAEIQIDQKGAKEVVFYRTCYMNSVFYESSFSRTAGGFHHEYEVWNLDTKQCLFEVTVYYKGAYKNELMQKTIFKNYKKGKTFYQCTFDIEENGNIHVQKIRGKDKCLIEKKEGVYVFKEGTYQLVP